MSIVGFSLYPLTNWPIDLLAFSLRKGIKSSETYWSEREADDSDLGDSSKCFSFMNLIKKKLYLAITW